MNRLLFVIQFAWKSLLRKKAHTLLLCLVTTLSLIFPYSGLIAFHVLNGFFTQTIVPGYEDITTLQINSNWYLQEGEAAIDEMINPEIHQKSVVYSNSIGTLTDAGYFNPAYLMTDAEGLDLLSISIMEGRGFTEAEAETEQRVAMISETFSQKIKVNEESKLYVSGLAYDIIGIYRDNGKSVIIPFPTYLRWKTEVLKETIDLYIKTKDTDLTPHISDQYGYAIKSITLLKDKTAAHMKSSKQMRAFIYIVVCIIFVYSLMNMLSYMKFKIWHQASHISVQLIQGAPKRWILMKLMLEYVYIFVISSACIGALHSPILKLLEQFYIYPKISLADYVIYLFLLLFVYLVIGLLSLYPVFRLRAAIPQRLEGL